MARRLLLVLHRAVMRPELALSRHRSSARQCRCVVHFTGSGAVKHAKCSVASAWLSIRASTGCCAVCGPWMTATPSFLRHALRALCGTGSLVQAVLQHRKLVLLLDYDGTLTPIVDDPSKALLSERVSGVSLPNRSTVS